MLRIQREANGQVVLRISGRLDEENLAELRQLLQSEEVGRSIVLDLRDLTLVDHEAVRFLEQCESDDIELRNCPAYICEWIERQRDAK
ncbi:MAG TPA: STAS domain-containing protein [Pyrinomonadaceae bacterium]|nr:STAS domain-containing protein [Pyrinomonadaceae bacterium]